MRRLIVVVGLAAIVIGGWWLAEDGKLGKRLSDFSGDVLDSARGGPAPSWGDVADRVGEFAEEERGLKQTVGRLDHGSGVPGSEDPSAAPDPPEALEPAR